MRRIGFAVAFAVSLVLLPRIAEEQPAVKVYRIGLLATGADRSSPRVSLRQGLRDLGYAEGTNLVIEERSSENYDALPALAADLVRRKVDLIVTYGTPGCLAAKQATTTIPIVMAAAGDPVRSGLVASLARPGGNITGLSIQDFDLIIKRIELLKETVPNVTRVAFLQTPGTQPTNIAESSHRQEDLGAKSIGVQLRRYYVRGVDEYPGSFSAMAKDGVQALTVQNVAPLGNHAAKIAALAVEHKLPTIGGPKEFAEAGGLLAYGPNLAELSRRAAVYVDKILKGAKPADLPVEQPTKFELVLNLKTAKALGQTIPQSVLVRADEIIQ